MTSVVLNQIAGNIFIFLLGCFCFFILSHNERFTKHGHTVFIYVSIFLWFAALIRQLVIFEYLEAIDAIVINGFAALLPLLACAITYLIDADDRI